jgi:hypothetical protein
MSAAAARPTSLGSVQCEYASAHHAPPHLHDAVLGVGREDTHVALERERETDADRVPVDRGDDGLAHAPRGKRDARGTEPAPAAPAAAVTGGRERRAARREIGARAERGRRAGHDDGANRIVPVAPPIRVGQRGAHRGAERVALLGPVQRDRRDAAGDLEAQIVGGHTGGCVSAISRSLFLSSLSSVPSGNSSTT